MTDLIAEAQSFVLAANEIGFEKTGKNIQFSFQSPLEVAPVKIERVRFFQILDNLVKNAVEAIDGASGAVMVSCFENDGSFILSVKDNGTGMPEEIQRKVFEMEYTTKQAKGTGLGLPIVRSICDEAGAKISFHSKPGEGTEFLVQFAMSSNASTSTIEEKREVRHEVQNIGC